MSYKILISYVGLLFLLNVFFAADLTPSELALAIQNDNLATVQRYRNAGWNFNWTVVSDLRPLMLAIVFDSYHSAREILEITGIDLNYTGYLGRTPISRAASTASGSNKMLQLLLSDEICNIDHLDHMGNSVLHLAATHGHGELVAILLSDDRVQRNIVNMAGQTPLDLAIETRNIENAILLLKDPSVEKNEICRSRQTILHLAVRFLPRPGVGFTKIVETIIREGLVDLNIQNIEGQTALHYAAIQADPEIILTLTEAGANSIYEDIKGHKAVFYAERRGLPERYLQALRDAEFDGYLLK